MINAEFVIRVLIAGILVAVIVNPLAENVARTVTR